VVIQLSRLAFGHFPLFLSITALVDSGGRGLDVSRLILKLSFLNR
jgi:hypothetical protein